MIKPTIFIGSSMEGLPTAKVIESKLKSIADCTLWTLHFDLSKPTFTELEGKLAIFDYGIFVATKDDVTVSRKKQTKSIRDNVILEYGMFIGRIGSANTFLVAEKNVKLPTDLNGVTLLFFETKIELNAVCLKISKLVNSREKKYDFGFFPSTALAYGYFNNFLLKALKNLLEKKIIQISNKDVAEKKKLVGNIALKFKNVNISVLIPDDITSDMFDKVRQLKYKKKLEIVSIEASTDRPFDFSMELKDIKKSILNLTDIPLTLNSLNESIKAYASNHHVGDSKAIKQIQQREIKVFIETLKYLIDNNSITKNRIIVEVVDI